MPAVYTCSYCDGVFAHEETLDKHQQDNHATIKVKIMGEEMRIEPDEEGRYHCPCSHHHRPATYPNTKTMVTHLSRIKWVHKNVRLAYEQHIFFIGAELVETELFSQYNLCINLQHKFILCVSCSFAFAPGHLHNHIKQCAGAGPPKKDEQVLLALVSAFQIRSELPEFKAKSQPRLSGIQVQQGFACPECPSAYLLYDTLVRHRKTSHPGAPTIDPETSKAFVQRLQNNNNSSWFVVSDVPNVNPALDILSSLKDVTNPRPPKTRTSDPRNICPWLRTTKWDDLIQGKDIGEVIALVGPPTKEDFPNLSEAVLLMFKTFGDALEMVSDLNLQRVNTEDSDRSHNRLNHTPFGKLQNHATTIKQYSLSVGGLLAMMLRKCPVPLPNDTAASLEELRSSLLIKTVEESAEAVYALLSKIWTHPWPPALNHRVSDPTIVYLALSNVLPDGRFKDAHFATNPIARLKYSVRSVIVILMRKSGLNDKDSWALYGRWLQEDTECTFRSLCSAQHIASSISYTTMSLPKVWWMDTENYTHMLYRGTPLHLSEIQNMVRNLEEKLVEMFQSNVLMKMHLRADYTLLHDDLPNQEVGYSFINDSRNPVFSKNRTTMLEAVLAEPDLWHTFALQPEDGSTEVRFRHTALRIWLTKYAEFQEHLLAYIYLTSGAPPRGTELTAMLMVNTQQYPQRNILACGQHIVLTCTYLKTSQMTGSDKLIPHSLSAFASDLLVQDLAIVRPFAQMAARIAHQGNQNISELYDTHVFVNHTKLFTTEDLSGRLGSLSLPFMQVQLNVSTWRHIFSAFRRKLCHRLKDLMEVDDGEDIESAQMGHSGNTEKRIYGVSHHSIFGASEDILPLYCSASTEWQTVLCIHPGGVTLSFLLAKATENAPQPKPKTAERKEASGISEEQAGIAKRMEKLEKKSDELSTKLDKVILLLEGSFVSRSGSSDTLLSIANSSPERIPEPTPPMYKFDSPLKALQAILDSPLATWKNEWQEKGVQLALAGKKDVIAVLPTGSGKSIIAILPPSYEISKTTVLVLPLRVLLEDYARKLREMKVDFEIYTSQTKTLQSSANLILVAADSIPLKSWNHYISLLNEKKPVARLIVDEAHIVLLSTGFREAMENISVMRCNRDCQVILLTATAPNSMIEPLRELFCLERKPVILRAPTNRPELKYCWNLAIKEDKIATIIQSHVATYVRKPEERAIIFVTNIAYGQDLATKLGYPFYNGQLQGSEQRKIYVDWNSGTARVCVATSAFGTGNDYAHVRLVVHVQAPFEMTNLIQEVCRAGRDSKPALCLLIHSRFVPSQANLDKDPQDLGGRQFLLDSLRDIRACIRFRMTLFVDGKGVHCSELPENQLCSRCASRKEDAARHHQSIQQEEDNPSLKARRRQENKAAVQIGYVENFQNQLKKFENACAICVVFGQENTFKHQYANCPVLRFKIKHQWSKIFDLKLKYPDTANVCFFCHVPQDKNKILHRDFSSSRNDCVHLDVILPTVYAIMSHQDHLEKAHQVGLLEGVDLDAQFSSTTLSWLNGKASGGHRTRLTEVFLWFAETLDI